MGRQSPLTNRKLLIEALEGASSKKEVLERLRLRPAGGNYRALDKALERFNLKPPKRSFPANFNGLRTPDDQVFCENSTYSNGTNIKTRLKERGFPQECSECHIGPEWNGKPLTLQLEHINGVHSDNRIENLTLLCPNCHSQTVTFAGSMSNRVWERDEVGRIIRSKCECGENVFSKGIRKCTKCVGLSRRKTTYPEIDILVKSVKEKGYTKVAEELGVSDNAIRKHIKAEGQEPPKFYKARNTASKNAPVVE